MTGVVLAGLAVAVATPLPLRDPVPAHLNVHELAHTAHRRFGFAFRRTWAPLIAMTLLFIAHWGVIVAYLPQRAEAAGADIGLFFVADGVSILASRVPAGWLADRIRPAILIVIGLAVTAVTIVLLAMPPTTPLLIGAGLLSGGGAGLVMAPILVELSRRSGDADRGSAFSLFSAALAGSLVLGSIGMAPVVAWFGFEVALLLTLAGIAGAAAIAVADGGLRSHPVRSEQLDAAA
jgi:predicted MFS family arabinose efflux permease